MNMHRLGARVLSVGVAGTAIAASLIVSGPAQAASSGSYDIGIATTLSGEQASSGQALINGTKTYLHQFPTVNGHSVTLHVLDTRFDPSVTEADVQQLIQKNDVNAFVDFFSSNEYVAAAPLLKRNKVVAFGRGYVTDFGHQAYLYGTAPPIEYEGVPAVKFAATLPQLQGKKNITAVGLAEQSAASNEMLKGYQQAAKAQGWKFTGQQVPPTATDLSAQATAAVAKHPQVVLVGTIAPQARSYITALRQQGYTGPVIGTDLAADAGTLKAINDPNYYASAYYSFIQQGGGAPKAITNIAKAAKAIHVDPNQPFVMDGYAEMYVLAKALKTCGYPCAGPKLNKAVQSLGKIKTPIFAAGSALYSHKWHVGPQSVTFFKWNSSASKPVPVGTPQALVLPS